MRTGGEPGLDWVRSTFLPGRSRVEDRPSLGHPKPTTSSLLGSVLLCFGQLGKAPEPIVGDRLLHTGCLARERPVEEPVVLRLDLRLKLHFGHRGF